MKCHPCHSDSDLPNLHATSYQVFVVKTDVGEGYQFQQSQRQNISLNSMQVSNLPRPPLNLRFPLNIPPSQTLVSNRMLAPSLPSYQYSVMNQNHSPNCHAHPNINSFYLPPVPPSKIQAEQASVTNTKIKTPSSDVECFGETTKPIGFGETTTPVEGFGETTTPIEGFGETTTPIEGFGETTTPIEGFGRNNDTNRRFWRNNDTNRRFWRNNDTNRRFWRNNDTNRRFWRNNDTNRRFWRNNDTNRRFWRNNDTNRRFWRNNDTNRRFWRNNYTNRIIFIPKCCHAFSSATVYSHKVPTSRR
ncbi:hypothetical protein TNCV_4497451 [Trichonephila clavipes]|nr:hypothetical protein TNCV_4497451 [Trichonephila clavipes]